jgi:hypothetical protein
LLNATLTKLANLTATEFLLTNVTSTTYSADFVSPWLQSERDAYMVGNDWDWRSQKSFGDYENDYYETFRSDLLYGGDELLRLARDLMLTGSDFNEPFVYSQQWEGGELWYPTDNALNLGADAATLAAQSGDASASQATAGSTDNTTEVSGRRRLEAWGAARRLQGLEGLGDWAAESPWGEDVTSNVTVLAEVQALPHLYQYVTEVGGVCEKISFAHNTSAPGAAVHVRYEDDRHYPVDKVVGAGSQDTVPSMQGCSGDSCPSGDQTDPVHHKHRCPAGSVVTGIVSRSGDWLDSVEYVCSPLRLLTGALADLHTQLHG